MSIITTVMLWLQVFVTLRGTNAAALTHTVTSNGAYISRRSVNLPPLHPIVVRDGATDSDRYYYYFNLYIITSGPPLDK